MMRAGAWRGRQPRLVDKEGECIIRPNNLQGSFSIWSVDLRDNDKLKFLLAFGIGSI